MAPTANIAWPRLLAEAVAIVASILLAFAIDAWWQNRNERQQAAVLAHQLRADFEASQAHLTDWRRGTEGIHRRTGELLALVKAAEVGEIISVPGGLIVAAIGAPTYSPTDSAMQIASATGQLGILDDDELHNALARWRQLLADTSEDELLIREIVVSQLVPALSQQARLGQAFEFENITAQFAGQPLDKIDTVTFSVTTDIEAALAERHFYSTFVVNGLSDIFETQASIIEMLGPAE
jgi:hypothetical protein